MEDSANQNPEALEALISKIFTNISSLKSAYIQLQSAHTPYDPDKIQAADKDVISELKNLSELKHFYRENNPKPICVSPQDSRLAAEIQEQQSLLKTYEVMVKKFQSEIQNKDSEILQLQQMIEEANQKRAKLEKNLKLRGLSTKESEGSGDESGFYSVDLTPDLFISVVETAFKAIHDFSKPLINMMKAAGWDLDAAANSIESNVVYAKRAHKKYAFESHICQRMFSGFQHENFSIKVDSGAVSKETFFPPISFYEGNGSFGHARSEPRFCFWEILQEQIPGGGSPKDGGFILWKFRSAKLYKMGEGIQERPSTRCS
ncbi:protein GRAVITROPIC IN THE LIGHT 1 [Populus alba x Populus x berolinensis]|uniref:Protein GRAVITROPIC IN THE LIGHT 1 n=1 Tax=Populus alba x Populus x berolinensis TaxID=444605 RepID=A0AAD6WD63_9ROSI|nr:protein GRAVITROPIC IN THE LIGHT 1 [Populus alba x Populus x berolinensis]